MAQPCSINLGADRTICQGQTTTLTAPAGFPNYLWSTGSSASSITVGTAGTYWGQASYPSAQLFPNSDFSAGNTGFSTQFNYSSTLVTEGNYFIGTNAATYHPQFIGTGTGNFLMVNSGWPSALFNVYCQTVTVCPQQTYTLSYRVRTLSNAIPARLQWWVDGAASGPEVTLPNFGGWQTITYSWTSGVGQTNASLCLRAMSGDGIGNDFALDDITMQGTINLRDFVDVSVTPLPVVDLGPNVSLCAGQSLVLDAGVAGGTYLWQDGATSSTYVVNTAGNYTVTVTANGCSVTDAITVNYNALPTVNLGPDLTLCSGQSMSLNAFVSGGTYGWQDGSTSATFHVTGPGNYSVNVNANGCSASDAIDIAYNPTPIVDLGPDQTLCVGDQAVLDATTPGATYLWQDGSTGPTFTATTNGPYGATVTVNGCPANDLVNLSFTPLPIVDLGPDRTICPGGAVLLNATVPGGTYLWQDGSSNATFNASAAGNYDVTVTANGCPNSDSFTLALFNLQTVDLGPDVTFCQGGSASIGTLVPGATYAWSSGETGSSITVASAGIRWLDVTLNGCTVRDSIEVFVTPLPVVDLGLDRTVCPGDMAFLDATTPGATYMWNNGAVTPTINVPNGNYDVTVTVNGCDATDAVLVNNHPTPLVDLGADVSLCPGTQLVLDATQPAASYLWQDGSLASTFTVVTDGTYTVDLIDTNGCTATDAITVVYTAPAPIDLGPDLTICQGSTTTLDATVPGATYLWTTGAVTPTITVGSAGNFGVTVTQGSCTVADAIIIAVAALPTVALGNDLTLCPGEQVVLDATGPGLSYAWSTGAITPTITVSSGGTYDVTVTNAANCTATDAVDIAYASPSAIDLGADVVLCQGEDVVFDATLPGSSYEWSTGASTPTVTINTTGEVWVEVTQGNCSVSDTVQVQVRPMPQASLGNDATLCAGEDILLDATWPGATYLWSTGAITPTLTVATTGTYSVDVDLNGCVASDAIDINVLSATSLNLGPDVTLCAGEQIVLDATTPGSSYDWSTGASSATITVTTSGTYWAEVSTGQCSVSDTVVVTVNPMPQVALGNDATLCAGEDILLDATWPGATYLWSTGAITPTLTVATTGTYSVDVDLNGCAASDAIDINVLSATSLNLGPDVTLCAGEQIVLDATTPGSSYDWSTGASSATITVTTSGTYWTEVSTGQCSVSDTVVVTVNPMPQVALGTDATLCAGEDIVLNATWPGASYLWNTGAVTPTLTVTTTGTYSVDVDLNGCAASDAIDINVLSATSLNLGPDVTLCAGEQIVLDATTPGSSYDWSTGASSATITVTTSGTYWTEVSTGQCSVSDTVVVTVNPMPQVALGTDATLCAGEDIVLNATWPGATYLWSTGAITPTLTVATTGTYSVDVDLNGCAASDAIDINVLSATSLNLGPDVTLCAGEQIVLDATTPGSSYDWSTGASSATITVTTSGTYWTEVSTGQCSVSDTVVVTVNPMPQVALGNDATLCAGEDILLDATWPGATYLWSTGAITPTLTVATTGTYSVDVDLNGCLATEAIDITVLTPDAIELGNDIVGCEGDAIILDATIAGASYLWNTGEETATLSVNSTGTYWVQVSQSGCVVSDTIDVQVNTTPQIDLGADRTFCEGETIATLDATWAGATYLWNTGADSPMLDVSATGTYSVDVDLNGCNASDVVQVTFGSLSIDLGADTTLCAGQTLELTAPLGAGTATWNDVTLAPSFTVTEEGTYWVVFTSGSGCDATDTITVQYNDPGTVDLGPDLSLCEGQTHQLNASLPGAVLHWEDGSSDALRTVNTSGMYSVEATVGQCIVADAIAIDFNPLPSVELGADVLICPGSEVVFDATLPDASYFWQDGSTEATLAMGTAGEVTVTVNVNGCSSSDEVLVGLLDGPTPHLGADATICQGASLVLTATESGSTYHWDNASTQDTRTITSAGSYWVDVSRNGCTARDTIAVTVFDPNVLELGDDRTICTGSTTELDATVQGAQYVWSTGATTPTIDVGNAGIYGVTITVAGCTAQDAMQVAVLDLDAPDLGPDISICEDASVDLTIADHGGSISWSTGATGPVTTISEAGVYTVTIDSLGCSVSDMVMVTTQAVITEVDLGEERSICPGAFDVLEPSFIPGATYTWSTGAVGPLLSISAPGTYSVTATGTCINARASVLITAGDCDTYVFVPDAFTPNSDGINDVFLPSLAGPVDRYELYIFDRWGERIATIMDRAKGWDGSYNNVDSQDGVYVWTLFYRVLTPTGVKAERLTGHVTLLR